MAPFGFVPPPYSMCSQKECLDRERFAEVSVFECRDNDRSLPPNKRTIDPRRAVSKYRRSAAGSSTADRYPVRSVEQLSVTVEYLLDVLAEQSPPPHQRGRESMLATVSFVEDRLRAVQVDLVKLQHPASSRALQARMARCHILILYIMGDCQSYEAKFGNMSLQTAMSSYLESSDHLQHTRATTEDLTDEVLSYAILYALRQDLLDASSGRGNSQIISLPHTSSCLAQNRYLIAARLRYRSNSQSVLSTLPSMYQWTMRLVSCVLLGDWHVALKLVSSSEKIQATCQPLSSQVAFLTLCRCLMSPCLQCMRLEALKAYNASLGKGEAVPISHVAHMVQISPSVTRADPEASVKSTWGDASEPYNDVTYSRDDSHPGRSKDSGRDVTHCASEHLGGCCSGHEALQFGQGVGLPVDDTSRCLVFKVVASSSLRIAPGSRNVRNDEDALVGLAPRRDGDDPLDAFRVDESGIRVPPPDWIRRHTRNAMVDGAAML